MPTVLAIESSCDENSAAIVRDGVVLSLDTVTQRVHLSYGGVVPELAGRSHLELTDERVQRALNSASCSLCDLDAVAATTGPGLVGSLLVGVSYAQALAHTQNVPFIPVHHMEGHLWSVRMENPELPLPCLVLLVSGGHTLLVIVRGLRDYDVIGGTLDDALGEAYDKVGKLLGLKFPAGAEMDKLAASGNPRATKFPVAMRDDTLNLSFSGLKTAVAYCLRDEPAWTLPENTPDLIASFQKAALDAVEFKLRLALKRDDVRSLAAAGGVAANSNLRSRLNSLARESGIPFAVPAMKYCADNAAMIAYLAEQLLLAGVAESDVKVKPRWPLADLPALASVN